VACMPPMMFEKEMQGTSYAVRAAGFLLSVNAGFVNGVAFSGMYGAAVSHVTGEATHT
jgi:uncharacterized membrane protein YoaK (UPF0700 family)